MQHLLHIREILAKEIVQIMSLRSRGTSYAVLEDLEAKMYTEALQVMVIIVKDQVMVSVKNTGREECLVVIWITDKV